MKPKPQSNTIPLGDALKIFWEWQMASICVEVAFFGQTNSSETIRASIDGVVTLVESPGIVTISGDGREIELDLRGSEIARARDSADRREDLGSLDPDSILQVAFPAGEICLVFPYRRFARVPVCSRRPENGLEWLRSRLAASHLSDGESSAGGNIRALAMRGLGTDKARRGTRVGGTPFLQVIALVVIVLAAILVQSPLGVPRLLADAGLNASPLSDPQTPVWIIQQSGNYYCRGSLLEGREPGAFMKQADALTLGYQPALGHYCSGADAAAAGNAPRGAFGYFRAVLENSRLLLSTLFSHTLSWVSRI